MLTIKYLLSHPLEEFKQLSQAIGGEILQTKWHYNNAIGKGFMEFHELDEGLFLYTYESKFHQPICITRIPGPNDIYFILNYDISGVFIDVEASEIIDRNGENQFTGIFLASSKTSATFKQPVNKQYRGVKLVIRKEWIEKYLYTTDEKENQFMDYLLKIDKPVHLFETIDSESLDLIRKIFESVKQTSFVKIKLISHSINLLQLFFARLAKREEFSNKKFHFIDLGNIFEARSVLLNDFSQPCHSLKELARIACMSESKFARLFKEVFGVPYFQYYRSERMKFAKSLLESGKYSVQEVCNKVGYQHPGKFSQAFKKEHHISPKDVMICR